MLNAALLEHPVVRGHLDALVATRGGLVVYDQGLGGREMLVAGGVRIALATGKPLTIVQAELLRTATADLIDQLGPVEYTFLSPEQAAAWPAGFDPGSVLAIHDDALRTPTQRETLSAAAQDASHRGHLLIARHFHGSPALDTYTVQTRLIRAADFMPAPTPGTGPGESPQQPGPVARAAGRLPVEPWLQMTWIPPTLSQAEGREARRARWAAAREPDAPQAPSGGAENVRRLPESEAEPPPVGTSLGETFWVELSESEGLPGGWGDMVARKARFIEQLNARRPADSGLPDIDIAVEELLTALEDPLAREALQERLAPLEAESRARTEQALQAMTDRADRFQEQWRRGAPERQDQRRQHDAARPGHDGGRPVM